MTARQGTMKGVIPPLNIAQEAALLYVEAKEETKRMKERENKRKEEMIRSAAKLGVDVMKVRDSMNNLHIIDLTNDIKIKHSRMTDVKIEKIETIDKQDAVVLKKK